MDQLKTISEWTDKQKSKLIQIALDNSQVWYILNDDDIKEFYMSICENYNSDNANKVLSKIRKS